MHIWSIQFTSYQVGKLRQIVEDRLSTGFEKGKGSQDAIQRLCLSMHGEDEAKRSTDGFMPGLEKVSQMMVEKLDMKLEKVTDKLKKEIRYVEDEVTRSKEKTKNVGDLVIRNKRILEKLLEHSDRRSSRSSRRRCMKSRDSDSSRSGSRKRSRSNSSKRRTAEQKQDLVTMLEKINFRIGLQQEMLERQNIKIVEDVMPSLQRLIKMTEMQDVRRCLMEQTQCASRDHSPPANSYLEQGRRGDDIPSVGWTAR